MQIIFHGVLADKFPHLNHREWNTDSITGAVRLINANSEGGFYRAVRPMDLQIFDDDNRAFGVQNLDWSIRSNTVHIAPAVEGSGRTAMVIAGTVLLVMAAAAMTIGTGGFGAPAAWGLMTAGQAALLGTALVVGGMMMPAASDYDEREERRSTLYSGGIERQAQGSPVPLVLGRKVRQGGVIISTGLDVLQDMYDPEV